MDKFLYKSNTSSFIGFRYSCNYRKYRWAFLKVGHKNTIEFNGNLQNWILCNCNHKESTTNTSISTPKKHPICSQNSRPDIVFLGESIKNFHLFIYSHYITIKCFFIILSLNKNTKNKMKFRPPQIELNTLKHFKHKYFAFCPN